MHTSVSNTGYAKKIMRLEWCNYTRVILYSFTVLGFRCFYLNVGLVFGAAGRSRRNEDRLIH